MPQLSTRRTIPSANAVGAHRLHDLEQIALRHGVPIEDVLLIAVNLHGITSDHDRNRARVNLRLTRRPETTWQIIVPLNRPASPLRLRGDELSLNGEVVAHVERIDADEAVGGYFRDGGRAATLNPNARSRCVGCGWCPNTLEAAADPKMQEEQGLDALLRALGEQHPRRNLAELTEVTVSTGCFEREGAAVDHLTALRPALERAGVTARDGFLTSVLRSDEAFATIRWLHPVDDPATELRTDPALAGVEQQLLGMPDRHPDGSLTKGSGAAPIHSWWRSGPDHCALPVRPACTSTASLARSHREQAS